MYSLMSILIIASWLSNMNSASALASSVLPTPVGPRNRKLPIGRSGSCRPRARAAQRAGDRLDRLVLADDPFVQTLLHVHQLLGFALHQTADRDTGPARDDLGDVVGVDLLFEEDRSRDGRDPHPCRARARPIRVRPTPFPARGSPRSAARPRAAGWLRVRRAPSRRSRRSSRSFRSETPLIACFSSSHCSFIVARALLQLSELALDRLAALLGGRVLLLFQRVSSISSCITRRLTSSISVGSESISMRIFDAASSIRSIALSGRKRSAM